MDSADVALFCCVALLKEKASVAPKKNSTQIEFHK